MLEQQSSTQQKELAQKQALLDAKSKEVDEQKEKFDDALSNISRLHLIIRKIPLEASLREVVIALGQAIDQSIGIQAFEIAYTSGDDIVYRGYSRKERGGFTFRKKDFNEKNSLAAWTLANREQLIINDFRAEHVQYIEKKKDYFFQSMIFIPFKFRTGKEAVLCTYNVRKNQFRTHDALMLQLLTDYIALATTDFPDDV